MQTRCKSMMRMGDLPNDGIVFSKDAPPS